MVADEQSESFVSFGEQGAQLTYGSYLRLPQLLDTQHLESDPPAHDELLFITIHQVYELWFEQLLHEAGAAPRRDDPRASCGGPSTCSSAMHVIERVLVHQVDVLETMTPQDFLEFRQRLAPASGFQSVQFRELEFLSGAKDASYVERFRGLTEAEQQRLDAAARRAVAVGRVPRRPARPRAAVRHRRRGAGLAAHASPTTGPVRRDLGAGRGAAPARRARRELAGPARGDGRADDRRQVRHGRLQRVDATSDAGCRCATTRCCGTCAASSEVTG